MNNLERLQESFLTYITSDTCHLFGKFNTTSKILRDSHVTRLFKLGIKDEDMLLFYCKKLNNFNRKFLTVSKLINAIEKATETGSYLAEGQKVKIIQYLKLVIEDMKKITDKQLDELVLTW